MSDNATAMERREAQGSSQGPARPGTPTPFQNLGPGSSACEPALARPVKGASQAPWRLPALHSPHVEGEKEKRDTGEPGARTTKNTGGGALATTAV